MKYLIVDKKGKIAKHHDDDSGETCAVLYPTRTSAQARLEMLEDDYEPSAGLRVVSVSIRTSGRNSRAIH